MKAFIKESLYFNRAELRGIAVLIVLMVLAGLVPEVIEAYVFKRNSSPPQLTFFETVESAQQEFVQSDQKTASAFKFDPNTANEDQLLQLGLPAKVVKNLIKYRSKGGKLYKPEDFKRIYGVDKATFERLRPYINIKRKYVAKAFKAKIKATVKSKKTQSFQFPKNPQSFDPNTADSLQLSLGGLNSKQISMLLNYRAKGGRFYKKEALKKLYAINDDTYEKIQDYIIINKTPRKPFTTQKVINAIDINAANQEAWESLPGIGPTYASRILKFRDALGGFQNIEQISETFALPDSVFTSVKQYLRKQSPHRIIHLNTATKESLKAHPYINGYQANAIIRYRERKGKFTSVELLKVLPEFDVGTKWNQLLPYFTVDDTSQQ